MNTEEEMVAAHRREEAALLADHRARVAALPVPPEVPPGPLSDAFLRRHATVSATRAAGVLASSRRFADDVRAMVARHRAEGEEMRAHLQQPPPPLTRPAAPLPGEA